ncbi:hypothetical protein MASR2M78_29220 [Treponema sp.]
MKKTRFNLAIYSNSILIILVIFSFMSLIALISHLRRETISKIIRLNSLIVEESPRLSDWQQVQGILLGSYAGKTGDELNGLLKDYKLALDAIKVSSGDTMAPNEIDMLQQILVSIMNTYAELLQQREPAFDALFYFLLLGILLQSSFLLLSLAKNQEVRKRIESQNTLLNAVQETREEERRSLASTLHDTVIQDLGSLGLHQSVREDGEVRNLLNASIEKLRNITYNLTPLHLEKYGLEESLRELIREVFSEEQSNIDFTAFGLENVAISKEVMIVLYRVVQEGFNNIRKYAFADKVELRLVVSHPYLILSLRDNGRGFDSRKMQKSSGDSESGMGLALLYQQSRSIGAELNIQSEIGSGTRLQLRYNYERGAV